MRVDTVRRLAADERLAAQAGFWWGLAEGTAFFIVPDLWITFATLFSLRSGAVAWLFSVIGSGVAVVCIYVLTAALGLDYLAFLELIPGISAALIKSVGASLAASGLPYTPWLVLGRVPLKLYAGLAFDSGLPLVPVLAWTAFARMARIAPTYLLAAAFHIGFRRRIDAQPIAWTGALALFWVAFYVLYFSVLQPG
jgi:hypothetical protein